MTDLEGHAPPGPSGRSRARPLPPDQRREEILAATVPLLIASGFDVTTRQIAEAAGVAEGTLFRVFGDKDEILQKAVEVALDPAVVEGRLAQIDPGLPLRVKVTVAAGIVQDHLSGVIELFAMLGRTHCRGPEGERPPMPTVPHDQPHDDSMLERLFEQDVEQLRLEPSEVARLLRMMTLAGTHPRFNGGRRLEPPEIASILLDGVIRR